MMNGIPNLGIPNITLTNPLNKEQTPSPAQSPIKDGDSYNYPSVYAGHEGAYIARPVTPGGSWGTSVTIFERAAMQNKDMRISQESAG